MAKSCSDVGCAFRVLSVTVVLLVAILATIVFLMVTGAETSAEVTGKVTSFGVDYATSSELPRSIVSIELGNGKIVNVEGARGVLIGIGDAVVLQRSGGLFSSDVGYRFLRVEK